MNWTDDLAIQPVLVVSPAPTATNGMPAMSAYLLVHNLLYGKHGENHQNSFSEFDFFKLHTTRAYDF